MEIVWLTILKKFSRIKVYDVFDKYKKTMSKTTNHSSKTGIASGEAFDPCGDSSVKYA